MLPKKSRLRTADFKDILPHARSVHGRFMSVSCIKDTIHRAATGGAFAIVVSKNVAKQAVARNKLRRQLYSVIGEHKQLLTSGSVCAVFLKKGASGVSYQELKDDLLTLVKKIGLLP